MLRAFGTESVTNIVQMFNAFTPRIHELFGVLLEHYSRIVAANNILHISFAWCQPYTSTRLFSTFRGRIESCNALHSGLVLDSNRARRGHEELLAVAQCLEYIVVFAANSLL
jgi:hypothetical protein